MLGSNNVNSYKITAFDYLSYSIGVTFNCMKILHLCGGSLNSGATLGATALHKGLLQLGVDSELIFSKGEKSDCVPAAEPFFRWQAGKKIFDASTKWIEPSILRRQTGYKRPGLSIGSVGHPFLLKRTHLVLLPQRLECLLNALFL